MRTTHRSPREQEPASGRVLIGEAENCREQAKQFAGRPEESLLVRLAGAFETLDADQSNHRRHTKDTGTVPSLIDDPSPRRW
jgi:hypothetical protein